MNRRHFLKCIGAFAASTALPVGLAQAKVARALYCGARVIRYECAALDAFNYTFTAGTRLGLMVFGVPAKGGETVIEVPLWEGLEADDYRLPTLSREGLSIAPGADGIWHEAPRTNEIKNNVGNSRLADYITPANSSTK